MQKTMTESNKIPTFYYKDIFDISEILKMREHLKMIEKNLTLMTIFIKTFSLALLEYPVINSLYDANQPF